MQRKLSIANKNVRLICAECGNQERFIEVMAEETHLVNSRKDYIRLLEGIADHYLCWQCGAPVKDPDAVKK